MAGPPRARGAPAGDEPVFRAELVELAPSRGLALFGIAGALVSVLALVFLGLRGGAVGALVFLAVGLALLPFVAKAVRAPVPRKVEAGPEGLRLDGKLRARRADVESAMLVPASAGEKPRLRVRARYRVRRWMTRQIELVVEDEAQGAELARALGQDGSRGVLVFRRQRLGARALAAAASTLLVGFGLIPAGILAAFVSIETKGFFFGVLAFGLAVRVLFFTPPLVYRLASPEVVVGADGFELRGALANRFVPYAAVEAVEAAGVDLVAVSLRSGERIVLRTGYGDGDATAGEVRRRMGRDLEAHRRGEAVDLPALLARGAEPLASWLGRLRAIAADASPGHRRGALPAESLWAVVENSAAPSGLRVGAASVLAEATRGEPDGAAKLGEIADAAASPELRRALRVAMAGKDAPEAELEESILAVERLEGAVRGRGA